MPRECPTRELLLLRPQSSGNDEYVNETGVWDGRRWVLNFLAGPALSNAINLEDYVRTTLDNRTKPAIRSYVEKAAVYNANQHLE